jgi:hypothetical protein
MKTKHLVQSGIFSVVLLVFAQSGIAALWEDPNAIMGMKGSAPFSVGPATGYVDYAVYAPGKYAEDYFIYAYQVFNESPLAGIDYFSINRSPDVLVPYALFDPDKDWAVPGGCIPTLSLVLQESVLFVFQFDNISPNEHSRTLLFASDSGPSMGMGLVGGSPGVVGVPTPIPEPCTMALLGLGVIFGLKSKRGVRGE